MIYVVYNLESWQFLYFTDEDPLINWLQCFYRRLECCDVLCNSSGSHTQKYYQLNITYFCTRLQCLSPYVGNGSYCTLDSDRDGYPNMALRNCAESEREQSYCANDTCPTVFNLPQSDTTPCTPTVMEGISGVLNHSAGIV